MNLQCAIFGLGFMNLKSKISNSKYKMCKLHCGNLNQQSAISNRQSAIGNRQSAIGNRQSAMGDGQFPIWNLKS